MVPKAATPNLSIQVPSQRTSTPSTMPSRTSSRPDPVARVDNLNWAKPLWITRITSLATWQPSRVRRWCTEGARIVNPANLPIFPAIIKASTPPNSLNMAPKLNRKRALVHLSISAISNCSNAPLTCFRRTRRRATSTNCMSRLVPLRREFPSLRTMDTNRAALMIILQQSSKWSKIWISGTYLKINPTITNITKRSNTRGTTSKTRISVLQWPKSLWSKLSQSPSHDKPVNHRLNTHLLETLKPSIPNHLRLRLRASCSKGSHLHLTIAPATRTTLTETRRIVVKQRSIRAQILMVVQMLPTVAILDLIQV